MLLKIVFQWIKNKEILRFSVKDLFSKKKANSVILRYYDFTRKDITDPSLKEKSVQFKNTKEKIKRF